MAGALPAALAAARPRGDGGDPALRLDRSASAHGLRRLDAGGAASAGEASHGLWRGAGEAGSSTTSSSTTATSARAAASTARPARDYGDNAERFAFLCRAGAGGAARPRPPPAHRPPQRLADGPGRLAAPPRARATTRRWRGRAPSSPSTTSPTRASSRRRCCRRSACPGSVFRPAGDGVPRPAQLPEGRPGLRRRAHHRLAHLRPGDPDPRGAATGSTGSCATRRRDLPGILNGIDVAEWDPARDPHLPAHYDAQSLDGQGGLQGGAAGGARPAGAAPTCRWSAMVGRLAEQKGIDLVAAGAARAAAARPAARGAGQRAARLRGGASRARGARAARPGGGPHRLRRGAGPPHRGGRRPLPHAEPLRALRPEPDVLAALRHRAGGARGGRAGGHGGGLRRLRGGGPASSSATTTRARCSRRCAGAAGGLPRRAAPGAASWSAAWRWTSPGTRAPPATRSCSAGSRSADQAARLRYGAGTSR